MIAKIQPISQPLNTEIPIPGCLSYTIRALVIGAYSKKPVEILNPLDSDDVNAMVDCLNTLGIKTNKDNDKIIVTGSIDDVKNQDYNLNINLSGRSARLILPLLCIVPGIKVLTGAPEFNQRRPVKDLISALIQMGAKIEYQGKEGFLPVKITSRTLNNKNISLPGNISSQYFSALMLVSPLINGLNIMVEGEQTSKSYIDITIDIMKTFGVGVVNNDYQEYQILENQEYQLDKYTVEGDFSSACYFGGIAALTKSKFKLKNLNPKSVQGDKLIFEVLEKMGNEVIWNESDITIQGKGVLPIEYNMESCPDQGPTLSVLAAFADGKSKLTGLHTLRIKETDRIVAVETELAKMIVETESTEDTLTIHGANASSASVDTYHDHRIAMSFAMAGTIIPGMQINNAEVVSKSFPTFWNVLNESGIEITILK